MSKTDNVLLCVRILCSTLRMEAINPNESFVPPSTRKHKKVTLYHTVSTHTFPPAVNSLSAAYRGFGRLVWKSNTRLKQTES